MSKRLARTSVSMTVLTAFMTLLLAGAAPALAHHRSDHVARGADSSSSPSTTDESTTDESTTDESTTDADAKDVSTEDGDTNDDMTPNNVSDDGDNAHPSGNDRSIENGGSGNQGDAQSNPDDTKGPRRSEGAPGADEPNGPGGTDLADQDGNNGCGNDDDFNDDNNGNCGPRDKTGDGTTDEGEGDADDEEGVIVIDQPEMEDTRTPGTVVVPEVDELEMEDTRTPGTVVVPEIVTNPSLTEDVVLGTRTENAPRIAQVTAIAAPAVKAAAATQSAALPFTGASLAMFLMVAVALMTAGLTTLRMRPATIRKQ